jgi:putative membrane protein
MWGYGPYGYGMMGWSGGFWPYHGFFWLFVIALVVVVIVLLVRAMSSRGGGQRADAGRSSPGLAVLEERYARGDINRDEFLQKKRDIAG